MQICRLLLIVAVLEGRIARQLGKDLGKVALGGEAEIARDVCDGSVRKAERAFGGLDPALCRVAEDGRAPFAQRKARRKICELCAVLFCERCDGSPSYKSNGDTCFMHTLENFSEKIF